MKLYVWNRPYDIPFGGSILYAVAENLMDARKFAEKALISNYGYKPDHPYPHKLDLGKPDRVCDLPYAEIYEWSE